MAYCFFCFRREEVSGEAQRVLRTFSTVGLEKEDQKPMPSFPDMVAYVQEKVRLGIVVHSCLEPEARP